MATTPTNGITISETTASLARMLDGGGVFFYEDLTAALGIHRDTLDKALFTLEDLGAISYVRARRGRPLLVYR
jgi:transcription initiation factor IIE alpha subunit